MLYLTGVDRSSPGVVHAWVPWVQVVGVPASIATSVVAVAADVAGAGGVEALGVEVAAGEETCEAFAEEAFDESVAAEKDVVAGSAEGLAEGS